MKKTLLFILCFLGYFSYAQHTISGTFSPADEYSWIIAYRLTPTSQAYVADTSIKKGQFNLEIPKSALPGTYRIVYAVPQDEFYFDILYSGNEDIILDFKSDEVLTFSASKENILFSTYFNEIADSEQGIINYYSEGNKNTNKYNKLNEDLLNIQNSYENKANNLLVSNLIKANRPFISTKYLTPTQYIESKKKSYFEYIDLNNSILQSSQFIKNKLVNYVFTALPLKTLTDVETENEIQLNIKLIATKIQELPENYQFVLLHAVWENAIALQLNNTADFILNEYLTSKAKSEENKKTLEKIVAENRLRIGAIAPEIEWQSKGEVKKLSTIKNTTNYLVIFWSSTCSHCLHELPAMHKELKKHPNVKVIAVGLEDDEVTWRLESEKLADFEHAIALGKWESKYAKLYDIHQTPTYYILDNQKRIIAKPESDKEVIKFLEH
ncbi:redoxin domain-containing protein [Aurantibacter crassamenti]|uniref:TlpA family protein disulfide reductase n=1 Tax=Aurantibacter crassamenti TaxID=1837375 RepID=UPI00193963EC|nr:thioredoxin-like domain-containing protein [Aurantibacter crassamenti]MBM1105550.1 redoxin domain-containing protein [Aurantibacter crassamenti]